MTLAAIVLFCFFSPASAPPLLTVMSRHNSASQSSTPNTPANSGETQEQAAPPPASQGPTSHPPITVPPSSSSAQASSAQKTPEAAKRRRRKKKVTASNCNAPASSETPNSAPSNTDAATVGSAQGSPTQSAPTNCPPPKIIVQQGGTSEPSIQLAGGAGDKAKNQRDSANQMLTSTDANLKKIAGRQLTSNQKDMVNQIHQFVEQSKAAVTAGDLDRARTFAWKAQLLSQELVNSPQ
jgi:hypothetical protein